MVAWVSMEIKTAEGKWGGSGQKDGHYTAIQCGSGKIRMTIPKCVELHLRWIENPR